MSFNILGARIICIKKLTSSGVLWTLHVLYAWSRAQIILAVSCPYVCEAMNPSCLWTTQTNRPHEKSLHLAPWIGYMYQVKQIIRFGCSSCVSEDVFLIVKGWLVGCIYLLENLLLINMETSPWPVAGCKI